jgi:cation transport regulator
MRVEKLVPGTAETQYRIHLLQLTMPYATNDDLPAPVRDNLPAHAQDIYREAFNHAFTEYGGDEPRSHRVAWAAVEHKYQKVGGRWTTK